MVATHVDKEAIWLERLLGDVGDHQNVVFYCDNKRALHSIINLIYHAHTNHIDIQYHFVCDVVVDKNILLQNIHTDNNVSDMLSEPIVREKFVYCGTSLKLVIT